MSGNYKNNYIKDVIFRVDFPNTPAKLMDELDASLAKKILEKYPIFEKRDFIVKDLKISAAEPTKEVINDVTEFVYHGQNRDRSFVLSSKYMYINHKSWISTSFAETSDFFLEVLEEIINLNPDLQVTRLGLRYINHIRLEDKNPLSWKTYLNKNLISALDFIQEKSIISRQFNNLELTYGDMKLRFQYGMHNPDYPAPIKKKLYVLDYDAYYQGIQGPEEIKTNLKLFNNKITDLFELSIKEGLRKKMRE